MPIYEYRCDKCEEISEYLQKMNDEPKTECPKCQGKLEKIISHTSFQLKGTGWYATDSKNKKPPSDSGNKD